MHFFLQEQVREVKICVWRTWRQACKNVLHHPGLRDFLGLVLKAGNFLNNVREISGFIFHRLSEITNNVPNLMEHLLPSDNNSCGKYTYVFTGVCLSMGERCTPPCQADTPPPIRHHPPGAPWADTPLPSRHPQDGYCSGRYASYWNAFIFHVAVTVPSTDYKFN